MMMTEESESSKAGDDEDEYPSHESGKILKGDDDDGDSGKSGKGGDGDQDHGKS